MGSTKLRAVVYTLGILGLYGTWGRTIVDGTLLRLLNALHGRKPFIMPGTTAEPLRTSITGVYWPIDYLLNMLILFFWEAVDGSHPTTSAVALYFAGQHLSIVTLLYVDSLRYGNAGKWTIGYVALETVFRRRSDVHVLTKLDGVFFLFTACGYCPTNYYTVLYRATLWLLIFQLTAIGTSGPWFAKLYCSASPLSQTILPLPEYLSLHLASPTSILLLPFAATISYIIPIILMALRSPSVVSHNFKQLAIALWNVFPLVMTATHWLLRQVLSFLGLSSTFQLKDQPSKAQHLQAIRITYAFSLTISCACHISIMAISAASVFFPMMFAPAYRSAFRPGKLLLPPTSWTPVSTFGEGGLGFMKWDETIGYACMLFVAGVTFRQAQDRIGQQQGWGLYYAMIVGCIIGGPGSAALAISWAKDEMLVAVKNMEKAQD